MTEVIDARYAQGEEDPWTVDFWSKISPPSVALKAQMRMAIQVIGTITDFAIKSQRRVFGCMYRNGTWMSQKMMNEIIVIVVMP
jgi:hypothetical protein